MRPQKPRSRRDTGAFGEDLAAAFLLRSGLKIIARNLRTRFGEIDILARRRRHWVAVEVKTRSHHSAPERCLSPEQRARVERALRALAPSLRPRPKSLRTDVIAVRLSDETPDLRHFPGTAIEIDPPDRR